MRNLSFVTIHPDFIHGYFTFGVFRAAADRGLAQLDVINLRNYAVDHHGSIDDRPYGGGDSMVMRPEPLRDALAKLPANARVILPSPAGALWTQAVACELAVETRPLVFLCPRFAGVDQRFIDRYVDDSFSMGPFIVAGGELPALMMADSLLRLVPGVLGNPESARRDSFSGDLEGMLEHPVFTRPQEFEGQAVPSVLLSGDHAAIEAWRRAHCRQPRWRVVANDESPPQTGK